MPAASAIGRPGGAGPYLVLLSVLLTFGLCPLPIEAQRAVDLRLAAGIRGPDIESRASGARWLPGPGLPDSLRPIHPLERGAGALLAAPGSAAAGWIAYTLGVAILAPEPGRGHPRDRERVILGSAAIGLVLGWRCGWLSDTLDWDCPQSRARRLPVFGRPERPRPSQVPSEHPPEA